MLIDYHGNASTHADSLVRIAIEVLTKSLHALLPGKKAAIGFRQIGEITGDGGPNLPNQGQPGLSILPIGLPVVYREREEYAHDDQRHLGERMLPIETTQGFGECCKHDPFTLHPLWGSVAGHCCRCQGVSFKLALPPAAP